MMYLLDVADGILDGGKSLIAEVQVRSFLSIPASSSCVNELELTLY